MLRLLLLILIIYFAVRAVRNIVNAVRTVPGDRSAPLRDGYGRDDVPRGNGTEPGVRRRDREQIQDAKFRDVQ